MIPILDQKCFTDILDTYETKPVVMWGAGKFAKNTLELFLSHHIKIHAICDNEERKCGSDLLGVPIVSPASFQGKWEDVVVQIACLGDFETEVLAQELEYSPKKVMGTSEIYKLMFFFALNDVLVQREMVDLPRVRKKNS